MENLVCNLTGTVRSKMLQGREHLVANATLIVPGVLSGNLGPLLYPPEEVGRDIQAWNGVPLVVYHPGNGHSAKTPSVLNRQGVGTVLNAFFDDQLRAELWFDAERTKQVDNRVYESLVNNQQIELSTGLQTQNEKAEENSVFNSPLGPKPYTHIARNYKPDHLAILPDQIGACSLGDGCGVFNKLSDDDVRDSLRGLLVKRTGADNLWIETIFANEVVFSMDGVLHRLKYTRAKDKVTLAGDEPNKVQRVTTYKVINHSDGPDGASTLNLNEDVTMAKKLTDEARTQMVDELVDNSCCWEENDRKELNAMTDLQLTRTKQAADKQVENEELLTAAENGFKDDRVEVNFDREKGTWTHNVFTKDDEDEENPKGKKKEMDDKKKMTDNEWYDQAPESVRNTLRRAQESEDRERKALVAKVVKNVAKDQQAAKVESLQNKSIEDLQLIASLLSQEKATRFVGQSGQSHKQVDNIDREDILLPTEL